MPSFNIIFAGTPTFAAVTLQALINSNHTILAVYSQPDRPAGRGRKLTASPVKQLALQNNLPVYQPQTLKDANEQAKLADLKADFMIVVAYGLLLPQVVLDAPQYGCINVHASLLPRWRGAAPIQRAILAGDTTTGITIMQMDAGLDTGDMVYKAECPILPNDTSGSLHNKLAELGAKALLHTLSEWTELKLEPQDSLHSTYAPKIKKEEAQLFWTKPAKILASEIRAFNPAPVAYFYLDEMAVRVWHAVEITDVKNQSHPGTILSAAPQGIDVSTSHGILRLLTLQLPGGKALPVEAILNARSEIFTVGKLLGDK